jgi:GTP pyrophosphokinase
MSDIKPLHALASAYLQGVDLNPLIRAYEFASERHDGQRYVTGEPYIDHLLAVASTLASMKLDLDAIIAGLLHGVIKENVGTLDELKKKFGENVANIVNGATRITNVRYNTQLAHEAENIRKLLLAMGADIRVLLVKLADRLQDMLSLDAVDEEEQRARARETMDLYAPLASRIGIEWLKRELEDLAFKYLFPVEYAELTAHLESTLAERQAYVNEVIEILYAKLRANKIEPVRIIGRPKHIYSIYKKLVVQKIPLERVYDKVAFRIVVDPWDGACRLAASSGSDQGLDQCSQIEQLPVAAHDGGGSARPFYRDSDSNRGDGSGGAGGGCCALGVQGRAEDHQW